MMLSSDVEKVTGPEAAARALEAAETAIRSQNFPELARIVNETSGLMSAAGQPTHLVDALLTMTDRLAKRSEYSYRAANAYLCAARFAVRDASLLAQARNGFVTCIRRLPSHERDVVYAYAGGLVEADSADGRDLWYQTRSVTRCLQALPDSAEQLVAFFRIAKAGDARGSDGNGGLVKRQMLSVILNTAGRLPELDERAAVYRDAAMMAPDDTEIGEETFDAFVDCVESAPEIEKRVRFYREAAMMAARFSELERRAIDGFARSVAALPDIAAREAAYAAAAAGGAGRELHRHASAMLELTGADPGRNKTWDVVDQLADEPQRPGDGRMSPRRSPTLA
jgi:hypothetical protein